MPSCSNHGKTPPSVSLFWPEREAGRFSLPIQNPRVESGQSLLAYRAQGKCFVVCRVCNARSENQGTFVSSTGGCGESS